MSKYIWGFSRVISEFIDPIEWDKSLVIVVVYLSLFSIHQKHVQESINRQLSLQKSLYRACSRVCVKASTRTLRWACSWIKMISFLLFKLNLANNTILKLKHKHSSLRSQVRVNFYRSRNPSDCWWFSHLMWML